ncbi:MAG: immunoglobulin-like domain-containing protein, partial [Candidatus Izemoplasmatales bacterium]
NELTEQEILNYYILMYNYVYGVYRDVLPIESTKEELITLDNSYLSFNFDEEKEKSSTLATYIFETISQLNDKVYSSKPQSISFSSSTFYYMTYKLEEPTKDNLGKTILDLVEQSIQLPQNVVESIELPATGEYGATITWVSADKTVIANDGTVTTPAEDTRVDLSYTIKVLGETRTGKINVNILTEGTNSKIPELTITYPTLKALIDNDDLYNSIRDKIANDKIYGSDANTNVNNQLTALRTEKGFIIYDYYLGIDYKEIDKAYENKNNGNKTLVAKLDSTLTSDEPYEITADDLFNFTITKNPALYTLQTAQFKELLYSEYYEESFGEQKNVLKNDSIRMDEMHAGVTNAKQYYLYMKSMYAQYNMEYPYKSFLDYAYTQYGTKTENALLEYFVATELKPYLINKVLKEIDIVDAMYPIVEDNFDNYFSLDATHLLVYIDFDEDGNSDNYKDYLSELGTAERDSLNSMLARLETALNAFEEDYEDLVAEYLKASRDDETWGEFKQAGILLLTQDLNTVDEEDSEVTHSLTYSGEYGIKDSYDESFTEALVDLYQEYNLPTNLDLEELESDLIVTNFGLHLILVQKGDDFERLSAKYPASSENADQYDEASYNDSDKPTVEQLELYATYKFYSLIYDLSNADVEEKYGITVPKIPTSVSKALDFYFDEILNQVYVLGTANIEIANLISQGNFLGNEELGLNDSEIKANLVAVKDAYYGAVLSKYFE